MMNIILKKLFEMIENKEDLSEVVFIRDKNENMIKTISDTEWEEIGDEDFFLQFCKYFNLICFHPLPLGGG